jgi:hypothetical protein
LVTVTSRRRGAAVEAAGVCADAKSVAARRMGERRTASDMRGTGPAMN